MKDETDFWQAVENTAYAIEGEGRQYEREKIKQLGVELDRFLADHPECADPQPLSNFAMRAVARLAGAFAFNDEIGADAPDFQKRQNEALTRFFDNIKRH